MCVDTYRLNVIYQKWACPNIRIFYDFDRARSFFCLIHVRLENTVRRRRKSWCPCTPTMNTDSRREIIIRRKEGSTWLSVGIKGKRIPLVHYTRRSSTHKFEATVYFHGRRKKKEGGGVEKGACASTSYPWTDAKSPHNPRFPS